MNDTLQPTPDQGVHDGRSAGETRTTHDQSTEPDASRDAAGGASPRVEPGLPHEIDESAHSQGRGSAQQVGVGQQALADEMSPSTDTDRGPVLDELYNDKMAPDRSESPPRQ